MISMIFEYSFFQNALAASLFAAIICGVIGVIASQKKLVIMSGGIAHTAYGGVGLGYLLGFEPIFGALIFAVIAAVIIAFNRLKRNNKSDNVVALLWSFGMALGVTFTGLMRTSYVPDINSYLFGNILSVTTADLIAMLIFTVIILFIIAMFFADFKAFLFDAEFCKIAGVRVAALEYLLLILIALSVVLLIRVVGIILVVALFSAPASSAARFSKTLKGQIILATVLSLFYCVFGLMISMVLGIASGAAIVFMAVLGYFLLGIISKIKKQI